MRSEISDPSFSSTTRLRRISQPESGSLDLNLATSRNPASRAPGPDPPLKLANESQGRDHKLFGVIKLQARLAGGCSVMYSICLR